MNQILPFIPPFLFGLALQRGRVHEGSIVIGQMTFAHFVMLKMFLSALGSSFLVSYLFFKSKCLDESRREQYYQRSSRGLLSVITGAALIGIGMTLSGSCPGTVYAQLGSLAWTAIPILVGALAGVIVFEQYIYPKLSNQPINSSNSPQNDQNNGQNNNQNIEEKKKNTTNFFLQMALPKDQNALYKLLNSKFKLNLTSEQSLLYIGSGLLAFTAILELLVNWKSDLSKLYPETWQDLTLLTAQPAIFSGIIIGIAQYISLFYLDKQLGCSFTFVELVQLLFKNLKPHLQSLKNPKCDQICSNTCETISNPKDEPYPITAIGITLGGFIGMVTSMSWYVGRNALDYPQQKTLFLLIRLFLGGFLAVLGARIAGGCTSGIGLSYTSVGSTTGTIGMMTMFGTAIFSGIVFKIVGM